MNLRSARKLFARAPATHRPMARWLWNDRLDPDRLAAQFDRLLDMGLGGALIRPGHGIPPGTYLSDAWFEAMFAVVRRARKRHASIWIAEDFDDPWTQEIVRGITAERPEWAVKVLRMSRGTALLEENQAEDYRARRDETPADRSVGIVPFAKWQVLRETGFQLLRRRSFEPIALAPARYAHAEPDGRAGDLIEFHVEAWPSQLSALHIEATRAFLDATHQRYHANLKKHFGNTLGLCITLNAGLPVTECEIPWDDEVPHLFEESFGYSLENKLPHLFFDLSGHEQVRYDFWSMMAEMFDEGFATPIEQWCDEHSMPGAIGFRNRSGLFTQVQRGGSRMWHSAGFAYEVIMPGVEHIGGLRWEDEHAQRIIQWREALSLRRQIDRSGGILASSTDVTGWATLWNMASAFEMTAAGAEFFTRSTSMSNLRANRRCQTQPVVIADSFVSDRATPHSNAIARLSWMANSVNGAAEVLVLHPIESLKAIVAPGEASYSDPDATTHNALVRHASAIAQSFADAHIDFDFGDEQIVERHGSTGPREFKIGRAKYSVVVLPPSVNMRSSTLALLQDFAMTGGHVIAVGTVPEMLDGRPSDKVTGFFREYGERIVQGIELGDYRAVIDRLVQLGARTAAALGEGGETRPAVYVRRGRWDALEVVTVVNGGPDEEKLIIEWVPDTTGVVEQWDPVTGQMEPVAVCEQGATARVPLVLARGAARLLVTVPGDAKSAAIDARPWVERGRLKPAWTGRRMQPNACALTVCRSGGGDWMTTSALRESLAAKIAESPGGLRVSVEWLFSVTGPDDAPGGWSVAVELGDGGELTLDGQPIRTGGADSLFDPAISLVPLPHIRRGNHTITLTRTVEDAGDLQAPWVLGPFAIQKTEAGDRALTTNEEVVALGPWSEAGLPSYFGEVIYRTEVEGASLTGDERAMLEIEWMSHTAEVRVNGKPMQTLFTAPFECDLTEHWGPGPKVIEIAVTNAPDALLAGLRDLDEFDVAVAGLAASPEIAIYGRGDPSR